MTYTFDQLKEALNECTGYDLEMVDDEDADMYAYKLIDQCGDQDGDLFYDLDELADYITNNEQVDQYLYELANNE
jgi:hypothetical protein